MKYIAAALLLFCPAVGAEPLVVHEWGTFTSLQEESGRSLGAINVDDEPVPAFVHDVGNFVQSYQGAQSKAVPANLPGVTMRLETPVIYFHLPPGQTEAKLDVEVAFRGGWLSQYYPDAVAELPDVKPGKPVQGPSARTVGKLRWSGLKVGGAKSGPPCEDAVWKAPRSARSDSVSTPKGETEQFLFYRGVGHLDSPLRVRSDSARGEVEVRALGNWSVPAAWLVEVGAGGKMTCSVQGPFQKSTKLAWPRQSMELKTLRAQMKAALIADGLYADEAQAMLDAWQKSYFQSPGARLFFIVPKAWTDQVLPLSIRGFPEVKVERVMIGRVELISPTQRQALQAIKKGDANAYQRLGRFRDVLVKLPAAR